MHAHFASPDDADASARWEALCDRAPTRSPFARPAYVRAAAQAVGGQARLLLVTDGEALVGGACLWERPRGPYRTVAVPPYAPYSGVHLAALPSAADVHARRTALGTLLEALQARYHDVRLHLPPLLDDVRPAQWRGFQAAPLYTYTMDTAPEGEATAGWSGSARRAFRNAADDYAFTTGADPAAVVRLAASSYARHDRPPPVRPDALTAWVQALQPSGMVRTFTVAPRQATRAAPEAGVVLLTDGPRAYYWIAGSRPGPAMTVLLGRLRGALHAEGVTTLDLVGANTPSIAEFKRRLGGRLAPYFALTYTSRPELRLWRALRSF